MKIEKVKENIQVFGENHVQLKTMGNIYEIRCMSCRSPKIPILKLDKDYFLELTTGEIREFKHADRRTDNLASVAQSLKHLREYINTNVTDPHKALFITLTYADNMQNAETLYNDFRKFNMRLSYYLRKSRLPPYEYIVAIEPQARGSLHAHLILIFQVKAPFIPHEKLATLWGHGFVKIKALKNIDNVGAYLSAYLGDMELDETLIKSKTKCKGFKIVESIDEYENKQSKAVIKGARLKLYPKGFRLFRKSRGIKPPVIKECTYAEAMQEIGNSVLTYEKTVKIAGDDGTVYNIINYRHYNKKRSRNKSNTQEKTPIFPCL